MLGNMLKKIRKDKEVTKISVAKKTGINIGHLTHIEKGERTPSHKALRAICDCLDIPFSFMSCLYDKKITTTQKNSNVLDYLPYNKIIAVNSIDGFVDCSSNCSLASIALKVNNDEMAPTLEKGTFAYIELNAPLDNNDIGVFKLNNKTIIRRFFTKKEKLVLKADNKAYEDINISSDDNLIIIGKVCNTDT